MKAMGYWPCWVDKELWMRHKTDPDDGVQYYLHLLCYMENISCIQNNADSALQHLNQSFLLNVGYDDQDMYLGAKLCKTRLHNGV